MSDLQALTAAARHALNGHPEVMLHIHDVLDSTNTEAKRHAAESSAPALYIARAQAAGRGRLGRRFYSPADTGLYMTLAYTTDKPLGELVHTTALAAVAASAAIETLTDRRPAIKWINDLYLNGKKTAGILAEAVTLPEGCTRMILGWGINLTTQAFPDGLRAPATALFAPHEAALVTDAFIGALAGDIARRMTELLSCPRHAEALPDGESCLSFYRRHLLYVGGSVLCTRGNECFSGILRGVDEDYSLLVDVGDRLAVLGSGEISVRSAEAATRTR